MEKKKKSRKWKTLIAAAVLVALAAVMYPQFAKAPEVETATVQKMEIARLVKETGTVEASKAVVITAKSAMEIKSFSFEEGDMIKAGDVILKTDAEADRLAIKSMESQKNALAVQYQQARTTEEQNRILFEQGAISKDQYMLSQTASRQLASEIAALQYSIESMRESVDAGGITSPISGTVTEIFADEGEQVLPGSQIMEISDMSDRYVRVQLISDDADLIGEGSKALVYNEDSGYRNDAASVSKVYLKAFEQISDLGIAQKRVTVEIDLGANKDVRLGSDVDVEIVVDSRKDALAVPEKAVFEGEKGYQSYVVENGVTAIKDIEIGLKGEDDWEVLSGLEEGDVVILSPDNDIEPGMKVKENNTSEGNK